MHQMRIEFKRISFRKSFICWNSIKLFKQKVFQQCHSIRSIDIRSKLILLQWSYSSVSDWVLVLYMVYVCVCVRERERERENRAREIGQSFRW